MSVVLTASTKKVNTPEYTQITLRHGQRSVCPSMTLAQPNEEALPKPKHS
jgi:hypothetical protein